MPCVLVTGGTSYIGSWVTRKLVEQDHKVIIYSRQPNTSPIIDIANQVNCVAGDVLDLPKLVRTIKEYRVERVIHMSALLSKQLEANPFMGYRVNVDGSLNVFEACRITDIQKVVYISTKSVYDEARGEHAPPINKPINEDYPKAPRGIYGATKLFVENMGLSYNRIYGLDFTALRFATTYGPGKQAHHAFLSANKILKDFVESAITEKPAKVSHNVDELDDLIYVKDIANGVVLACFAENLKHRIFHLGTGKGETLRNVIEIVDRIFGGTPTEIDPQKGAASSSDNLIFNIDRARQELGYNPQYTLEMGLRDYVDILKRIFTK
jgi:UDP-glucose 4-epimerase